MSNSTPNNDNTSKSTGLTTTHKIMIGGFTFIAIVLVIGIFVVFRLLDNEKPAVQADNGNYVIDENNLADITASIADQVSDSMFEVSMNTSWAFPDGSSPSSNAVIANSSANKYDLAFDVMLSGEDEPIYTSTIIPVGSQLNKLILEKPLTAGKYDAICNYHLLDKDGNEKSSLAVNVTINIEK